MNRNGDIQPTMARTVEWVRSLGLHTTDSGDGVTNVAAGVEGALDYPHVFAVVHGSHDSMQAVHGLWNAVESRGLCGVATVELSYDPATRMGIVALCGVTDANLGEEPAWGR